MASGDGGGVDVDVDRDVVGEDVLELLLGVVHRRLDLGEISAAAHRGVVGVVEGEAGAGVFGEAHVEGRGGPAGGCSEPRRSPATRQVCGTG
jgi:hypothetical protein